MKHIDAAQLNATDVNETHKQNSSATMLPVRWLQGYSTIRRVDVRFPQTRMYTTYSFCENLGNLEQQIHAIIGQLLHLNTAAVNAGCGQVVNRPYFDLALVGQTLFDTESRC